MGTPDLRSRMETDMRGAAAPAAGPATGSSGSGDAEPQIDLGYYRRLVRSYIDMRRYKTALYWAEKVVALSASDPMDVYWMAQCMFLLREFHRAAHVIRARGLERTNLHCLFLAAEALFEAKDSPGAIELLAVLEFAAGTAGANANATTAGAGSSANITLLQPPAEGDPLSDGTAFGTRAELLASVWLLKGRVLESMDNRALAMDAYIQALQHSVHCTEALDALVQHEMLLAWEEQELLANLPVAAQCGDADAKVLQLLYRSKLKKYYETNCPFASNAEQTPGGNMNYEFVKSIKVLTDRMKREHSAAALDDPMAPQLGRVGGGGGVGVGGGAGGAGGGGARRSATPYMLRPSIMSPANKLLLDLKSTPNYSIQSSMSRTSFSQLGDSLKSTPSAAASQPPQSPMPAPNAALFPPTPVRLQLACKQLEEQSVDMMVARAERLFYNSEYKKCMQLLDDCFLADPYHAAGLTVQIGCLVELKESNKLFYLAHNLIDLYPDQAISWYAVGCYYDLNNKSDPARRYLAKATSLDRLFGPAWLAYGHSFAKENEHDQAMAAYFKATQLMRGCHLPLLYIGVECGLTNNHELAEKFFYQAMSIAPLDVFVLHELGVIKFEYEDYESAEDILRDTLEVVCKIGKQQGERSLSARWEPLFNNLGHCCRKNGKYEEALQLHKRALALKPLCAGTYTAIAFVQALMGRLDDAIESLHRSLSIKRDDIFATTLLRYCIEDLTEEDAIPDCLLSTCTDQGIERHPHQQPHLHLQRSDDLSMDDDDDEDEDDDEDSSEGAAGGPSGVAPNRNQAKKNMATAGATNAKLLSVSASESASSSGSSGEVRLKLKFDDTVASAGAVDSDMSLDASS